MNKHSPRFSSRDRLMFFVQSSKKDLFSLLEQRQYCPICPAQSGSATRRTKPAKKNTRWSACQSSRKSRRRAAKSKRSISSSRRENWSMDESDRERERHKDRNASMNLFLCSFLAWFVVCSSPHLFVFVRVRVCSCLFIFSCLFVFRLKPKQQHLFTSDVGRCFTSSRELGVSPLLKIEWENVRRLGTGNAVPFHGSFHSSVLLVTSSFTRTKSSAASFLNNFLIAWRQHHWAFRFNVRTDERRNLLATRKDRLKIDLIDHRGELISVEDIWSRAKTFDTMWEGLREVPHPYSGESQQVLQHLFKVRLCSSRLE